MTENTQATVETVSNEKPAFTAEQNWAMRMNEARHQETLNLLRSNHAHATAAVEEVAAAAASAQVANEETATKVQAIFETVVPKPPQGFLDGAINKVNNSLDAAWRILRPAAAVAVTVAAGSVMVERIRSGRAAKAAAASAAAVQGAPTAL